MQALALRRTDLCARVESVRGISINIDSPRKLDDSMAYGAMQMAQPGQAVAITPFTLTGAMTPATMAGALAQQNAEVLLGVVLMQLTRRGAPTVYDCEMLLHMHRLLAPLTINREEIGIEAMREVGPGGHFFWP